MTAARVLIVSPCALRLHPHGTSPAAFQQLKGEQAARFPLGQLPVVSIDGVDYTQSMALLRWAGKKSGLYPTDEVRARGGHAARGLGIG